MHPFRFCLLAPCVLALGACAVLPRPADPQLASLARSIHDEAGSFFAVLAVQVAPACAYQSNAAIYDHLAALADRIASTVSGNGDGAALEQASGALARTIADARASHQAASVNTDDAYGLCMAPGAIALNADAVARASAAIASSQTAAGGQ